jgi:hypothetical protein
MLNHYLAGCYRYLVAISLSLATFFPLSAEALYQYQYSGEQIIGTHNNYTDFLSGSVYVTFDSANLLTGGEGFDDVTNFVMRFGGDYLDLELHYTDPNRPLSDSDVFRVPSVNARGLPTEWYMAIRADHPDGQAYDYIGTTAFRDRINGDRGSNETGFNYYYAENTYNPGVWTIIAASPVPEPETCAMMLAGLGMIGFVSRRRKQS